MTKEEYIEIRKNNQVTLDMLYEFYSYLFPEEIRKYKNINEFSHAIDIASQFANIDLEKIYLYFDSIFETTMIINNENRIIDIR